jgi:hypothetical protein
LHHRPSNALKRSNINTNSPSSDKALNKALAQADSAMAILQLLQSFAKLNQYAGGEARH